MADIDSLSIQISTDATSAEKGLDTLSETLGRLRDATKGGLGLSSIANQVKKLSDSANGVNGTTISNLKGLAEGMKKLSEIGDLKISSSIANQITKINTALSGLNIGDGANKISELVSALKPLETLGKSSLSSTVNALNKLPEALQKLDTRQLYTQIQSLTRIMQPLATEMQKIANGFNAFPSRIQKLIQNNEKLSSSNTKVGTSYINLYAKLKMAYNTLKMVTKTIAGFIKKSNDYIENLNLFTASMGEYAEEAKKYAEQVSEVMGIDPGEWMRNQGVFMTLATGFGVVGDRAYTMSKNLTQLGYDLSSFFNISYEDAMLKLQSGLAGELEPLRRIGYDLSVARLQQEAYTLGINKKVSAMTQAEKAELRYYAIMTQVTTAQGDMARTLNAPANQLRVLKAQVEQAGRAIGNIFIPALNAILPVAIAVIKVIRVLAESIASFFGFELPEVDYSGLGGMTSGAEDLSTALDGASDSAKKLQKYTMGFDELNVIDPNQGGSGDGSGGAGGGSGFDFELPEYDFIGDAVAGKAETIFNNIKDRLGEILFLVGTVGGALLLWKISTSLFTSIDTLTRLLKNPVLTTPMKITGGVILTVTGAMIEFVGLKSAIENGLDGLNFAEIVGGGGTLIAGASMIGSAFGSAVWGAAIGAIVAGVPMFFVGIYDACVNGLDWLSGVLIPAGATLTGAGIGAIIGMLGGPIGAGIGALIGLAVGLITDLVILVVQNWDSICEWCSTALEDIGQFFVNIWQGVVDVWNVCAKWFDTYIIKPVVGFFEGMWKKISSTASACWGDIVRFFSPAIDWFSQLFGSIFQTISDIFYNIGVIASGCWEIIKIVWGLVSDWFDKNIITPVSTFFSDLWTDIKDWAISAWDGIKSVFSTIGTWISDNIVTPVSGFFSELWDGFKEKAKTAWDGVKEVFSKVGEFFSSTFETAWAGIVKVFSVGGEIFVDIKDGVVTAFKKVVNGLITGLNKVISIPFEGINAALNTIKNIEILKAKPFGGLKTINIPQIPTLLAEGGMVSTGQMFIAREAGPELVGTIGNKSAVVNNEQIVASVSRGVAEANNEQNSLLREQNTLLRALLEKESGVYLDGKRLTNSVEKYQSQRGRQIVVGGAV